MLRHCPRLALIAILTAIGLPLAAPAQDHTILFSVTDPGVTRAMTNWGLDTCWASSDNMRRGLIYMGTNTVNIIRVGFFVDAPLTNNDVTPADKSNMETCANLAAMATAATKWDMNLDSGVNAWYQSGANTVYPNRWAEAMEACQRYYNKTFWSAEGFNEPDYTSNGEGSPQNLAQIFSYLRASTNFPGAYFAGGSTLDDDDALSWFGPIASRSTLGTTHCLAGSAANYIAFLQNVVASNAIPFHPELHNVAEAIIGANYGLSGGIWWGTAELARGDFANACQGSRLGYAEDDNNWTAAAVYRGTNGAVQAFLGGSERMAVTTTCRFFSRDRDVFYDGYGPRRDYAVTVPGGTGYWINQPSAEKVINITWGADVQPAINGRYIVVNRNSQLALEVPGASVNNGTALDQGVYRGALNQQWDISPLPNAFGGDFSYFTMKAAHDGVTADNTGYSYNNGNLIQQWNGGTNEVEQWYFQYAGNGYFKIRSCWDNKVLAVNGASTATGAQIVQWDDTGAPGQQWRLIPAGISTYDFVPPAAPTGVTANAHPLSIQLNWAANAEPDFWSYNVLRGATNGGPYDILARGLTNNTFTDKSANNAQTRYYVIQAVDRSLNTSANSLAVSATPALAPALAAHYTFDNTGADSSINANDAELVGGLAYVAGKSGHALSLNGSDQYAMAPAGIMASVTNFTISAWVNWAGGAAWQRIFDFGNDTTQYMFLTADSGNGTLRFAITTNGGGAEQIVETSPLVAGQWTHVAVTRSGNTVSLYRNGLLAASGSVTIPPAAFNPALNNLGASQYPADPFFSGLLDSVYIYNYALSRQQIINLMNALEPDAPAAPTALGAAAVSSVVQLTWSQSATPGIVRNNIYRSTASPDGPFDFLASIPAATNYTDTTVPAGTPCFYAVTAVTAQGESPLSNASGAKTAPGPPARLAHRYHFANGNANDTVGGANGQLMGGAIASSFPTPPHPRPPQISFNCPPEFSTPPAPSIPPSPSRLGSASPLTNTLGPISSTSATVIPAATQNMTSMFASTPAITPPSPAFPIPTTPTTITSSSTSGPEAVWMATPIFISPPSSIRRPASLRFISTAPLPESTKTSQSQRLAFKTSATSLAPTTGPTPA